MRVDVALNLQDGFPVRVSRGTEPCDGVEQKTCLSGASLFLRPSQGEYRSVPAEQAERSRGAGESRGVSRSTPLGPSGEDKHGYRCEMISGRQHVIQAGATIPS